MNNLRDKITMAERQEQVADQLVAMRGIEKSFAVGIVNCGASCRVDIRVRDGEFVRFAKFKIDDAADRDEWTGTIAEALSELAHEKGILPNNEVFCFDIVDLSDNEVWHFSRVANVDFGDVEDGEVLTFLDTEIPEPIPIVMIKMPDSTDGWKELIVRLGRNVFGW